MTGIYSTITIQPTRKLTLRRMTNGWIVWVNNSSPDTQTQAYVYLHDVGSAEFVQETTDGYDVINLEIHEVTQDVR